MAFLGLETGNSRSGGLGSDPYGRAQQRIAGQESRAVHQLDLGEQAQLRLLPFIQRMFGTARADASRSFDAARLGVNDQYRANLGDISGRTLTSGLAGTTVAQNARMGAGAQRSRGLLDVASQEAGLNTGLRTQEAAAGAGALGSLSDFYQSRADIENRVFQNYLQYRQMQKGLKADRKAAKAGLIGDAIGAATEIGLAAATGGSSLLATQGRGISQFGQGPTQGAGRPPSYYQTFT